jgi:hypothetical protein
LQAARAALVQATGRHQAVLGATTSRADEAVRPSRRDHRLPALILCAILPVKFRLAEAFLKLHLVARHLKTPSTQHVERVEHANRWLSKIRNQEVLKKVTLPTSLAGDLLLRCDKFGISAASVFPGYDGVVKAMQELTIAAYFSK